jgi:hypothetical protein
MATVYEIVGDILALEKLIEGEADPETGELPELSEEEKKQFLEWITENETNLETKFNNIYKVYRNKKTEAANAESEKENLKAEYDRLSKRAKARDNEAGRIKMLMGWAMDKLNMKKYKTALFSIGYQNTQKIVSPIHGFFNPDDIPVEFLKRELSPAAVKKAVEEGRLYEKEGQAYFSKLFYKDGEGKEQVLKGVTYIQGTALVIR